MNRRPFTSDLLSHLCRHEHMLLTRHGVRLRVERIGSDGRSVRCSVAQVKRSWLGSLRSSEELVDLAHTALMPLHHVGLTPLISTLPAHPRPVFPAVDRNDPFGVHSALRFAGLQVPRLEPPLRIPA